MKNLNRIHLNGLRALEAAGRLGSLQAAADELGVSAGAVSQQIIKAERQLGRVIFDRTPKGLVPTGQGAAVLLRLRQGFEELSLAVALASRRDDNVLTISVAPVFAGRWLVHRLDSFAAEHPDIRLRIEATTALVDIDTSDIDMTIRIGPKPGPGVHAEFLLKQITFPVCAPSLADKLKTPADLLNVPAVIDANDIFTWDHWLKAAGLDVEGPAARHLFSDASLCLDAAIAGQGVMLAWQTLAASAIADGRLVVPFARSIDTGKSYYFITSALRREPRKVTAFKQWVRKEISKGLPLPGGVALTALPSDASPSSP